MPSTNHAAIFGRKRSQSWCAQRRCGVHDAVVVCTPLICYVADPASQGPLTIVTLAHVPVAMRPSHKKQQKGSRPVRPHSPPPLLAQQRGATGRDLASPLLPFAVFQQGKEEGVTRSRLFVVPLWKKGHAAKQRGLPLSASVEPDGPFSVPLVVRVHRELRTGTGNGLAPCGERGPYPQQGSAS